MTSLVYLGRLAGGLDLRLVRLIAGARTLVIAVGLALPLTSANWARGALPLPFSFSVYPADVLIVCAVGLWLIPRILLREDAPRLATPLLGWPLALFALTLVPGIVRGHERYGAGFVGQPVRLVLYALVALAMVSLTVPQTYRMLVTVFYLGAAWQLVLGLYSLAAGSHQTGSFVLSTGGTRFLSVSSAVYMGATVILALLNFELGLWARFRYAHLLVAAIATLAVVLSFARTTFVALAIAIPVVLWFLRDTRSWLLHQWRIWAPALVVLVALMAVALPSIRSTFVDRVTANPIQDHTVRWRAASFRAALTGFGNGDWRPPVLAVVGGNRLANPSFEQGTIDWFTQGGTIATVPSNNPDFGSKALEFRTDGAASDEGPFSLPVLSQAGQSWRLSIWLNGLKGGEKVSLGLWEYDAGGGHTGYTNLPVTLSAVPTPYYVTTSVTSPDTAYVRVVIRTNEPEAIVGYADRAVLESLNAPNEQVVPYGRNYLSNSLFDSGTVGWSMQGGTLLPVWASLAHRNKAAEMRTDGQSPDEGMYSEEVKVHPGERWTFAATLRASHLGQVADVSIWQYDKSGESVLQTRAPLFLDTVATQYRVSVSVPMQGVKTIRALVRTGTEPGAVDIVVDDVILQKGDVHTAMTPAPIPTKRASQSGSAVEESLLGVGFGRSFNYMWEGGVYHLDGDPHNSFVWVLSAGGVLALGGLLVLLGAFVLDTKRRLKGALSLERALLIWVLATWFLIMMTTLTEPLFSYPTLLLSVWIVMLLPAIVKGSEAGHQSL